MSASGQTHAEAIGLTGYATDASGIGGLVKTRVEDFRVEELSTKLSMDQRGRFTVARITLRNWETNRFIARLAKALSIPKERIFFAGTKDKRAITRQLFVIDAPANKVSGVELTDVDIEVLGRTHQKIGFGNHRGNRFTITVRGCAHPDGSPMSDEEAMAEIERIHTMLEQTLGAERFPNWIGPQRFGSGRPVTAEVGRHVIAGRFEDAVMAYLSMPGAGEAPDVAAFRARVRDEGITEEVIEACPDWMDFERRMAPHAHDVQQLALHEHLVGERLDRIEKHSGDFAGRHAKHMATHEVHRQELKALGSVRDSAKHHLRLVQDLESCKASHAQNA
ncbi:MAG: tRNA pseudouridine(13) synthase TruD, partial [Candidatus Thermoplasmatota archaeon]|nr:tRNA pseudouridine(13) synthase TruD [Candidatus Thermoplasmatota archaeon]